MYDIKSEINNYKRIVKHHERLGKIEIALVTDDIAAEIMVALANHALRLTNMCPHAGEPVRVIDGPFMDFEGIVESRDLGRFIARVDIDVFTPVMLSFDQIGPY